MAKTGVKVIGGDRFIKELQRFPQEVQDEAVKGIDGALLIVQNEAQRLVQRGPKNGRVYTKKGGVKHQSSAPGQPPSKDIGNLVSHINTERKGLSGTVGVHDLNQVKYARRLEFGGRDKRGIYIAPRPFLFRALKDKSKQVIDRIERSLPESMRRTFRGR